MKTSYDKLYKETQSVCWSGTYVPVNEDVVNIKNSLATLKGQVRVLDLADVQAEGEVKNHVLSNLSEIEYALEYGYSVLGFTNAKEPMSGWKKGNPPLEGDIALRSALLGAGQELSDSSYYKACVNGTNKGLYFDLLLRVFDLPIIRSKQYTYSELRHIDVMLMSVPNKSIALKAGLPIEQILQVAGERIGRALYLTQGRHLRAAMNVSALLKNGFDVKDIQQILKIVINRFDIQNLAVSCPTKAFIAEMGTLR